MSKAFFYVEYDDGRVTEIEFKTAKMAEKAYNLYAKEPEANAKTFGWDSLNGERTLSQQIRAKKVAA